MAEFLSFPCVSNKPMPSENGEKGKWKGDGIIIEGGVDIWCVEGEDFNRLRPLIIEDEAFGIDKSRWYFSLCNEMTNKFFVVVTSFEKLSREYEKDCDKKFFVNFTAFYFH